MNLPNAAESTLMMTSDANAPEKTVTRLCLDARIAAMRNVLSPVHQHGPREHWGPEKRKSSEKKQRHAAASDECHVRSRVVRWYAGRHAYVHHRHRLASKSKVRSKFAPRTDF